MKQFFIVLYFKPQNGMNARELAVSKGRSDIVQTIDKVSGLRSVVFMVLEIKIQF